MSPHDTGKECNLPFNFTCYPNSMNRTSLNRVGLAAVILFAPGGFLLGAALAAKTWRDRRAVDEADAAGA